MAIEVKEDEVLWVQQDKDARTSYKFSLAGLLPEGDTLSQVAWTPGPGVTVEGSFNGTEAAAWISGGTASTWYACTVSWDSTPSGAKGQFVLRIFILPDAELENEMGSALFPNKFTAVAQLRRDRLLLAAQNLLSGVTLDSDYIWSKLRSAESEASHTLRVKFQPTMFFHDTPTQEQIDALNGMPWEEDPAYDYDPDMFQGEVWGFIATRNKPIISVQSLKYAYPAPNNFIFEIPLNWLKIDKKYGQVRIVPSEVTAVGVMGSTMMQLIGSGRTIPHIMQLTYVAGLKNAVQDYPELVDAVKKMAVLKIIEDSFIPQSGSISADGLSQTISTDMAKYHDVVDRILNGVEGSNGGLMAAIHGIRLGVM